jgi:transcriptional regulator with XRE-family HTH domain
MKVKLRSVRVREILLRRNLSQNGLAVRLGISSGYCSQLLSGLRYPSPLMRKRLLKVLAEDFDTLFEMVQFPEGNHAEAA